MNKNIFIDIWYWLLKIMIDLYQLLYVETIRLSVFSGHAGTSYKKESLGPFYFFISHEHDVLPYRCTMRGVGGGGGVL